MRQKKAFTLIEVLIVVAIIAIMATLAFFMFSNNLGKSRDGKRKADLDRIKTAFEEYYGDENIFPPETILADCDGGSLKPYLPSIPCDPKTKKPYCYVYDSVGGGQNYRVLASFENTSDPIIDDLGCGDSDEYCGYEAECTVLGYSRFNYGVVSSNIVVANELIGTGVLVGGGSSPPPLTPSSSPNSSLLPYPSTVPGEYACTPQGECNSYLGNPVLASCPITFSSSAQDQSSCSVYCPSPYSSRCPQ